MENQDKFFQNAREEELARLNVLSAQIQFLVAESFKHGDPASVLAQRAASLHKDWIELVHGNYDENLHRELASKYSKGDIESEKEGKFFKEAIFIFTDKSKNEMESD